MLISIHLHTDLPFGCSSFVPSSFILSTHVSSFLLKLVPMVLVSVFHLHDITCRWWEPGILESQALLAPRITPS